MLTALPAPHVYANAAIQATCLAGGTVVLQERYDAGAALELAEAHRATMIEGVPTMYAALLAHDDLGRRNLSSLTRCTVGGQTIPNATIAAWEERSGGPLIELWGMTEIAGLGSTHPVHLPPVRGSIGVSLPGVELRIADLDDAERALGPGQAGELMVRGPIVMPGYWGNPEATAEVLTDDGWLHTGDVATADDAGHYFVVDRQKDMIITAGYNVYPAEIERVIASHQAVSMVAVGRLPDELKGEVARAYIVLKPGGAASEADIIEHCRGQLAAYKVPRSVRFVDDLPKTSTGKIMRRKLVTADHIAVSS
jgi:long-chain acyl-CoA synthetase